MINISLAGIGGQGSVLAAKILAETARSKGWQVRTAETTGMAQRGGNVMSHVRMGDEGEEVFSPLPAQASDDLIIALEPGEGLRALSLLKPQGLLVTASSGVAPVVSSFKAAPYNPSDMIARLQESGAYVVVVDDERLCSELGSRKVLNIVMLAKALLAVNDPTYQNALCGKITLEDMREILPLCVKERFVSLNLRALDLVEQSA
ncbi:MAG: 2-oxoacid:acceptor oxidoreductase family protein [Eggerthellaceae bacterium]|nr:2-oxoacid:acceptor oxidoreductase family protein [Eggerthellaceae bacterium]